MSPAAGGFGAFEGGPGHPGQALATQEVANAKAGQLGGRGVLRRRVALPRHSRGPVEHHGQRRGAVHLARAVGEGQLQGEPVGRPRRRAARRRPADAGDGCRARDPRFHAELVRTSDPRHAGRGQRLEQAVCSRRWHVHRAQAQQAREPTIGARRLEGRQARALVSLRTPQDDGACDEDRVLQGSLAPVVVQHAGHRVSVRCRAGDGQSERRRGARPVNRHQMPRVVVRPDGAKEESPRGAQSCGEIALQRRRQHERRRHRERAPDVPGSRPRVGRATDALEDVAVVFIGQRPDLPAGDAHVARPGPLPVLLSLPAQQLDVHALRRRRADGIEDVNQLATAGARCWSGRGRRGQRREEGLPCRWHGVRSAKRRTPALGRRRQIRRHVELIQPIVDVAPVEFRVGRNGQQALPIGAQRERPDVLAGLEAAIEERARARRPQHLTIDGERDVVGHGPAHASRHARRAAVHDCDPALSFIGFTPRSGAERDERTKDSGKGARHGGQMILCRRKAGRQEGRNLMEATRTGSLLRQGHVARDQQAPGHHSQGRGRPLWHRAWSRDRVRARWRCDPRSAPAASRPRPG